MNMKYENDRFSKYLHIFIVVSVYWIVSMTTVFVNKTLLSNQSGTPLFTAWFQCVVSFIVCFILNKTNGIPGIFHFPDGTPWHIETIKKVSPLSLLFAGMVACNNICLQSVSVSFYYICRSLTTVFNVVLGTLILGKSTSNKCLVCCAFVISGFLLGVDQESLFDSFSLCGTVVGVVSSLMLSLYSIYTKKILPYVDQEVLHLSYYNNAYSVIFFIPLMAMNGELIQLWNSKDIYDHIFWIQMVGGGFCALAIGYLTSLQIKVTSPLTHNISGTAKACVQTIIATHWYDETKSFLWWVSNAVILCASALYARFKQLEMEEETQNENVDIEEKENLV